MPGRRGILTDREREVLLFVAEGNSRAHAPEKLGITYNTLITYLDRIYNKLNVQNEAEAVYRGMAYGMLPIPEPIQAA